MIKIFISFDSYFFRSDFLRFKKLFKAHQVPGIKDSCNVNFFLIFCSQNFSNPPDSLAGMLKFSRQLLESSEHRNFTFFLENLKFLHSMEKEWFKKSFEMKEKFNFFRALRIFVNLRRDLGFLKICIFGTRGSLFDTVRSYIEITITRILPKICIIGEKEIIHFYSSERRLLRLRSERGSNYCNACRLRQSLFALLRK